MPVELSVILVSVLSAVRNCHVESGIGSEAQGRSSLLSSTLISVSSQGTDSYFSCDCLFSLSSVLLPLYFEERLLLLTITLAQTNQSFVASNTYLIGTLQINQWFFHLDATVHGASQSLRKPLGYLHKEKNK